MNTRRRVRIGIGVAAALAALSTASTQLHAQGEEDPLPPPEHRGAAQPVIHELTIKPRTICVKRNRRCPHPGAAISFDPSDHAAIRARVYRIDDAGERFARRFFTSASPGGKTIRFRGRGLDRGGYRLELQGMNFFGDRGTVSSARFRVVR